MTQRLWTQVDQYLNRTFVPPDPVLERILARNAEQVLPSIDLSPTQGKFFHLLAALMHAERVLEIGTLGGYSTAWLARALPATGKLITLEYEPRHADVAHTNLEAAGLAHLVEIRVGAAADSLAAIYAEKPAPFDLIFIDADKPNNLVYLQWALKLSRPGSLIVIDNVIRDGEVADAASTNPSVRGTRACFEAIAAEPRLCATAVQTVGSKGYDGFAIALVLPDESADFLRRDRAS